MKRKGIALILSVALGVTSLAGCAQKSEGSDTAGTQTKQAQTQKTSSATSAIFTGKLEKNVKIQVLENDTAISKGYFKELIAAFNKKYASEGITAVDANMDQYLDLANDGPYGYGPDVLYQANDQIMQYAKGKHIYPIPVESLACYKQIPKAAWEAYKIKIDNQTYTCGVPVNIQAPMLYYRKDLLPQDWETTWDKDKNQIPDMIESFPALYAYSKERHAQDSTKYGYMKSISDMYFSSGFLFSYGGYIFGKNNTDPSDIGFAAGEAKKGANVLSQLASVMNEDCIDNTITTNAYPKMADGTYFATISTPDMYSTFYDELVKAYQAQGQSQADAAKAATDNLVMTTLPKLPKSGDLTQENPTLMDSKTMGGINGYAISAYTKYPNDCLAFVDFATSYKMQVLRHKMLGVAPAREDAAKDCGDVSKELFENLKNKNIILMPSNEQVAQIWTPGKTFFTDLAKDVFRTEDQKKYPNEAAMQSGLEEMVKQIHDAIYTLN